MYALVHHQSVILAHESQNFLNDVKTLFVEHLRISEFDLESMLLDSVPFSDRTVYYSDLHTMLNEAESSVICRTGIDMDFELVLAGKHEDAFAKKCELCREHLVAGLDLELIDNIRRLIPARDALEIYRHHIIDEATNRDRELFLSGYNTRNSLTSFVVKDQLRRILMVHDDLSGQCVILADQLLPNDDTDVHDIIDGFRNFCILPDDTCDAERTYIVIVRGHIQEYIQDVNA